MKAGAMTPLREVVQLVDNDHHVMAWYETDGQERNSMLIEYTRAR